jgi:hypothetical protein
MSVLAALACKYSGSSATKPVGVASVAPAGSSPTSTEVKI